MDLCNPIAQPTYDAIINNIFVASNSLRDFIFRNSVKQEINLTKEATNSEKIEGLTVSGDGTWRKRGFQSLFGVSSLIGYYSNKILDLNVKSAFCKACEFWEKKTDTTEYEAWKENHMQDCLCNHEGSAGKMEVDAICEMFQRSDSLYSVKYINYIGDGDCKTFKGIVDSAPYGEIELKKKECVGHVQKRMGNKLRSCKSKNKGLGGKGKLTAKLIDELTVYYGLAIRRNCDSIKKMHDAIWATLYHKMSTDEDPRHELCPQGSDSWCTWQQVKAKGKLDEYHHKPPLNNDVRKAIEPIYTELSNDTLLERCVGGFTQNNNESFNSVIWKIAPKTQHSGSKIVTIAANVAAALFNDGMSSILQLMEILGINVGPNASKYCEQQDVERIAKAEVKTFEASREARITNRLSRSLLHEAAIEAEGTTYGAGIDD